MVELVRAGRSPDELAKEFEPTAQLIRTWVKQADADEGHSDGVTSAERAEIGALRREASQSADAFSELCTPPGNYRP